MLRKVSKSALFFIFFCSVAQAVHAADVQYLQRYMVEVGDHVYYFDADRSRQDGVPATDIELMEQLVMFQNVSLTNSVSLDALAENYPLVARFFRAAGAGAPHWASVHACGTFDIPVPNFTPPTIYINSANPVGELLVQGYHQTAGYACGKTLEGCAAGIAADYTRPRDYAGPFGVCPAPIFRDHGHFVYALPTHYSVQLGEPNPEVLSYVWPYPTWGAYAAWWHARF